MTRDAKDFWQQTTQKIKSKKVNEKTVSRVFLQHNHLVVMEIMIILFGVSA